MSKKLSIPTLTGTLLLEWTAVTAVLWSKEATSWIEAKEGLILLISAVKAGKQAEASGYLFFYTPEWEPAWLTIQDFLRLEPWPVMERLPPCTVFAYLLEVQRH